MASKVRTGPKSHYETTYTGPQSIHYVNFIGCQFSCTSNLTTHLTSLVFLFLTVLHVFSGHLPLRTSCKFFALMSFSVLALFVQLPQLLRSPSRTQSVHVTQLTLSGGTSKYTFPSSFQYPLAANSIQRLRYTCVTNRVL